MISVLKIDRRALPPERQTSLAAAIEHGRERLFETARLRGQDVVVVSTCERYEVFFGQGAERLAESSSGPSSFQAESLHGLDALRHLFRLAAGLDSRLVGEPHVLGQLRGALASARKHGTVSRPTATLFQSAFRSGRRARVLSGLAELEDGYAGRVMDFLAAEPTPLAEQSITIVGGGQLARSLAQALYARGGRVASFVGRHPERVGKLATEFGTKWATVTAPGDVALACDVVIAATSATNPLIGVADSQAWHASLFIDLGVLPNIDPGVDLRPGIRVERLERFTQASPRSSAVTIAESVIETEMARYLAKHGDGTVGSGPSSASAR